MSISMTLNDLKPHPLPPKKQRVLVNVSQFRAATHILRVNCVEMAGDRPKQPAYGLFSINVDFSSPSPDPLG